MKNNTKSSPLSNLLPLLQSYQPFLLSRGEVVIHAPGFEDRTMAIVGSVQSNAGARAILLDYRPYDNRNRLREIRDGLLTAGITTDNEDILIYHRFEPDDFEARLRERLTHHRATRALVDISSMSKLTIMLVLNVCRDLDLEVSILYAEAQEYGPSKVEYDSAKEHGEIHRPTFQVYTGVHGVVRVDSLASVAMQGQPSAAIVFMSFNDALTQVLLNTVYPSRLFLINGRPPVHQWRELATAWIHDRVRREWGADNPVTEKLGYEIPIPDRVVSTLDYRETVLLLLDLYWELSANHRILLAPSGTKMQTVACYLVKALHQDIHIEYPSPEGFSKTYSSGIGNRWLLNLGRFSEFLNRISKEERHIFIEIPT